MLSEGKVPEEYEFDVGSNVPPTKCISSSTTNTPSKSTVAFGMICWKRCFTDKFD